MQELNRSEDVDAALGEKAAVVFKHSTSCPISARARTELESFVRGAKVPVYAVDVNARADVSAHVAERTGIEHQSPQVIVVRDGEPTWHASRFDISAEALREQLGLATPGA